MIKLFIAFKRKPGMSVEDFRAHCRDVHTPLLFSIPEAEKIRRFVVSCPLPEAGDEEPTFDALVDVWFDRMSDMEELMQSKNYIELVDPDHPKFIDLSTMVRLITEDIATLG